MKNKKKVLIIIAVVVVILVAVGFVGYDAYQKGILVQETNKVAQMDLTKDEIDMTIYSAGRYGKIEKVEKEYMDEFAKLIQQAMKTFSNEELVQSLSIKNYKEDGPEFVKTKKLLEDSKTEVEELITKLSAMTEENTMMERIEKVEGLSKQDHELYRSLMLSDETRKDLEDSRKQLEKAKDTFLKSIDGINNILNFLSENKDKWSLTDSNILFNSASDLQRYNQLVNKLPR